MDVVSEVNLFDKLRHYFDLLHFLKSEICGNSNLQPISYRYTLGQMLMLNGLFMKLGIRLLQMIKNPLELVLMTLDQLSQLRDKWN